MRIIDFLYDRYLEHQYIKENKKKNVIFAESACINRECKFEGNNYIAGELYNCEFGYGSYVHKNSVLKNVKVGRFCAIAEDVNIRLFQHPTNMVAVSPCFYRKEHTLKTFVSQNYYEDLQLNEDGFSVTIGNDVWIGQGVSVKSGITIGDGAVIGTGAVVTKNVEPYAIVGGVPSRLIRYRFSKEQIEALLEIKWWNRSIEWLEENGRYFIDADKFIEKFKCSQITEEKK